MTYFYVVTTAKQNKQINFTISPKSIQPVKQQQLYTAKTGMKKTTIICYNTGMLPNLETIGRWLVFLGIGIVILGGILYLLGRFAGWEKFPGTLRLQNGNLSCIVPILGSILLSILFTIILNLIARGPNR
jgi:hypothetical protein